MNIVLLNTHTKWASFDHKIVIKHLNFGNHLGIRYVAAVLKEANFDPLIIDAHFEEINMEIALERVMQMDKIDLLGITTVQPLLSQVYELVKKIRTKHKNTHITLGGYGATFAYKKIFAENRDIDSVIVGEGEYSALELTQCLNENKSWKEIPGLAYYDQAKGNVVFNGMRELIPNLNDLPFPLRAEKYPLRKANMSASRGCHGFCLYCSIIQFYKMHEGPKVRVRSPENVINEMEYLFREKQVNHFEFIDDNFTSTNKVEPGWTDKFAKLILERNLRISFGIQARADDVEEEKFLLLKKVGLKYVNIGIESDSPRVIKSFNLGTSREIHREAIRILYSLDIEPYIEFIIFEPLTEIKDIKMNLAFAREVGFHNLVRQMPLTSTQHLVLYRELPIIKLYKNKKINMVEENDFTRYEFVYPEVASIAGQIFRWRDATSALINHHLNGYHFIAVKKGMFKTSKHSMKLSREYLDCDLSFFEATTQLVTLKKIRMMRWKWKKFLKGTITVPWRYKKNLIVFR